VRALVLTAYNRFEVLDVPRPEIGPDDVLVAVRACGICGSDVHGMDGSTGRRRPPIVMGHEASGVIAEVGLGVDGWAPGDRVTFDSTIYCGACRLCRAGRVNLCDARRVLGVSCEEYRQQGAFAEYVAVPERILYRLPEGLSFEHAAMVEPISIAFHAVRRTPLVLGANALVVGAGMIGLCVVQALRAAGCGRIIAVDLDEARLDLARRLGADEGVLPDQLDVRDADLAIECVGIPETVSFAIAAVRKGGHVTLVGNVSPKADLALQAVVTRELTLAGSCASCLEYPACLEMLARGAIDVEPLLSALAPLAEGASWFDRLRRRERGLLKVILTP